MNRSYLKNSNSPKPPRQCKSFCGVVNYLSLFCKDLQTLLHPIVELTRKECPFLWGKAQEQAFRVIGWVLRSQPMV